MKTNKLILLLGMLLTMGGSLYAQNEDPYVDDVYNTRGRIVKDYKTGTKKGAQDLEEARRDAYAQEVSEGVYPIASDAELEAYNRRRQGDVQKAEVKRQAKVERKRRPHRCAGPGVYSRRLSRFYDPDVRVRNADEVNIYIDDYGCHGYEYDRGCYDDGNAYVNLYVGGSSCWGVYDPWWPNSYYPWYTGWDYYPGWGWSWHWGWRGPRWGGWYGWYGPSYPYPGWGWDWGYHHGFYDGYRIGYDNYRYRNFSHGSRSNNYYYDRGNTYERRHHSRSTYDRDSRGNYDRNNNRDRFSTPSRSRYNSDRQGRYNSPSRSNRYDSPSRGSYDSNRRGRYSSPSRNSSGNYNTPSRRNYDSGSGRYSTPSRSSGSSSPSRSNSYSTPSRSSSSSGSYSTSSRSGSNASSRSSYTRSR